MSQTDPDERCVFNEPDCGPVAFYDASGEPWCQRCADRAKTNAETSGPMQ